ncbi:MAG: right-handed parallel beta-helix repeat-containing protein [Acidimicrobiales bacterium]
MDPDHGRTRCRTGRDRPTGHGAGAIGELHRDLRTDRSGRGFGLDNAYGVGILVADGHHFRITDNVVSGFPVGGIAAVRASHLRFERNVVFENSKWGPEQGSGLSSWIGQNYGFPDDEHGYTDYFLNNVIYRNENRVTSKWSPGNITDGNGIIIDMNLDSGFTGRTLIANNIIVDNGGRSITVYKSQRVDIVNNSTFANGRTGASLLGGGAELSVVDGRDVRLSNNLLWNDGTWPTMLVANSRDVTATANALVGGGVEGIASDGNLLLSGDPGVASSSPGPDSGDFHLLPGSPLIDAGVAIPPVVSSDVLGNARTVGGAVDIGAIEWSAGTAPVPRPSRRPRPPAPDHDAPDHRTPTTLPAASTPTSGTPTTAPATTSAVPERTPVTTADPTTDERADALPTPAAEPLALAPRCRDRADGLDPAGSPPPRFRLVQPPPRTSCSAIQRRAVHCSEAQTTKPDTSNLRIPHR